MALLCGSLADVMQAQRYYRDATRPSVFVEVSKVGFLEPLKPGDSPKRIWLTVHNNTVWELRIPAYGVPTAYGECGLFFEVMAGADTRVPSTSPRKRDAPAFEEYRRSTNFSIQRLKSGAVLTFSVPAEALEPGLAIRIPFSYGWESEQGVAGRREPVHFVAFSSSQMAGPKW